MLKSTSSPNKPWACALFPRAVDLDPARHGPKHILSARVSWLLPWRPRQIRHDECRLFAVWQTHSFTVGWLLHEEQSCATLSRRGKEGGREGKNKDNKNGKKDVAKKRIKSVQFSHGSEMQRSEGQTCVYNNAYTRGHYDNEKTSWYQDNRERSPFSFRQVAGTKKPEWEEWERRTKWAENKREIEIEKMHSAHSHVSNLAAFIAGLWDLCFPLTHRQSPVWYSPWQLNMGTNFRVVFGFTY